jgi:hypothetical protein
MKTDLDTPAEPLSSRYLSILLPQTPGACRDGYGYRSLEGGRAILAWVVDAPDDALLDTVKFVEQIVDAWLSGDGEKPISKPIAEVASESESRLILADLVTHVNESLCFISGEVGASLHGAAVFTLITQQGISVLVVGDCVAFVLLDERSSCYRFSSTTRLESAVRLDLPASLCRHPEHFHEAEYLGGKRRLWQGQDVIHLPLRGSPRLALMSDGPERQCGSPVLLDLLRHSDLDATGLEEQLTREAPVDDLTLLAFDPQLSSSESPEEIGEKAACSIFTRTLRYFLPNKQ